MQEARGEMRDMSNIQAFPIRTCQDLQVFRRAYAISIKLHPLTLSFPKYEQYGGIADQIRRASKSIGVNIAEGFAKRTLSVAEFKRYLMIAFGSAEEMRVWICYARDLSYLTVEQAGQFEKEYDEIAKMIYALHRNWKE